MSSETFPYPVALSQVEEGDSREAQNCRAVAWLREQPGGPIIVITPTKRYSSVVIDRLVATPGVAHQTWRGLHGGHLHGRRVLYAWPDRERLNRLWDGQPDALVVIEHGTGEAQEWAEDANPALLVPGGMIPPLAEPPEPAVTAPLPEDVERILEHVAGWAAGYDSGLKWNEEDKLKADMMNRPDRWAGVTAEQVRAKLRALKMRPRDVDTIVDFVERRRAGRRFNVRSSYRNFAFQ